MSFLRTALTQSPWAPAATGWLVAVVVLAAVAPDASPWGVTEVDWDAIDRAPSASHWFGTDGAGRDLLTRSWAGARLSLSLALLATAVSVAIGIPYGVIAGYFGGRLDQVMMRCVDALYALPFVFLVILLVVAFGRHVALLFVAIGAVSWLDLARIVRGQTLAARRELYVDAARALGATRMTILFKHLLPNVAGPAIVYATLTLPGVILAESFISFLGLGVQEPQASWGVLIADGAREMHGSWWQLVFPATLLAATLLAVNTVGDALRDALNRRGALATPRP